MKPSRLAWTVRVALGLMALAISVHSGGASDASSTTPNLKVAFIGDQGLTRNSRAVLELIKQQNTNMVIHLGDFDYRDDPEAWNQQINETLGPNFPYFATIGNHDVNKWPEYQKILQARLDRIRGASCRGNLGVQATCSYQGLFFLLSGVGTSGSNHAAYLQEQLSQDRSIWSICAWHKNQAAMQVGDKGNEVGWEAYEACRQGGAIIATAHEHNYERTKTLINIQNRIVDPAWPESNKLRVVPGASFVFVSGLGGKSIRKQERCLPSVYPYGCTGEWARIYALEQGAKYGALFITFHVDGDARKARGEFINMDGEIMDSFEIHSERGIQTR